VCIPLSFVNLNCTNQNHARNETVDALLSLFDLPLNGQGTRRLLLSQRTNLELLHGFKHVSRVLRAKKAFRRITSHVPQDLVAARMQLHVIRNVVHAIINDQPRVAFLVVLGDFRGRVLL
jgi:hypothetical protein